MLHVPLISFPCQIKSNAVVRIYLMLGVMQSNLTSWEGFVVYYPYLLFFMYLFINHSMVGKIEQ